MIHAAALVYSWMGPPSKSRRRTGPEWEELAAWQFGPFGVVKASPRCGRSRLGADRGLLVPDADRRRALWTPRVCPGALLVDGEIVGTRRRAEATVAIRPWGRLSRAARASVEAEAPPLPGVPGEIVVRWDD